MKIKTWRMLFNVFVLCMMVLLYPSVTSAADNIDSGSCGEDTIWILDSEGMLTISGVGDMDNFESTEYVPWYDYRDDIEIVKVEEGVTSIGDWAFAFCTSLTDVVIPDSTEWIGTWAFFDCSSLESITIPGSVDTIDRYAFSGCSSLVNVIIQEGVRCIRNNAFEYCENLRELTIPSSIQSLTSEVQAGGGGEYCHAFPYCSNLAEIKVAVGNKWFDSRENCNGIVERKTNTLVVGCKDTAIPKSVTAIGDGAFWGCSRLKKVRIPDSVTAIKVGAFLGCSNLASVVIPSSVKKIGGRAFCDCSRLTDISLPDGITKISYNTFDGCKRLTSIIIPDSVKIIEDQAFGDCSGLTSLTIPDGVEEIGWMAFIDCDGLTNIAIPDSVKMIDEVAFLGCDSLTDVYYSGSESEWNAIEYWFYNESLINAEIHYNSQWNFSLFQSPSTKYSKRLALVAAEISEKAEQYEKTEEGEAAIRKLYESYGLTDCDYFNFGKNWIGFNESAAFAIGQDTMDIDGTDTTVLVITARGSQTGWEYLGDLCKGGKVNFLGTKVWANVNEFYETIWGGVRSYIYKHPGLLTEENLKILINGHSLGGAAANMLGAMLTDGRGMDDGIQLMNVRKENIYVYTFGTIKVLTDENVDNNISSGYENIHNIYNYYDSFGPNGNWKDQKASAVKAKFGHTELYYLCEKETGWAIWDRTCNNHQMSNYKEALQNNLVRCSEEARVKSKERIKKIEKDLPGIQKSGEIAQIAISGPVNAKIYASNGKAVGRVNASGAGEMLSDKVYICTEGDERYIYLLDNDSYKIELNGTGTGSMTFSLQNIDMDTGETLEEKVFVNVVVESGKMFSSPVEIKEDIVTGIETDGVKLFVVKDDGEPEKEVLADGNGTEVTVDGKQEKPEQPEEPSIKVKKIKISGLSTKIAAGKKITLKAVVEPSNAANKSVKWKSGNKKYATVNSKGVVTLKKAGKGKTVTITATAKDGSVKKASYKIKIMKGIVKKVTIAGKTVRTAKIGTSVKLKAIVKASKGANKTLKWTSSNKKYATVKGNGKITLKKAGRGKTVRITVMATDGSRKKAVVKIKIK